MSSRQQPRTQGMIASSLAIEEGISNKLDKYSTMFTLLGSSFSLLQQILLTDNDLKKLEE
jgi:hypothetical protein